MTNKLRMALIYSLVLNGLMLLAFVLVGYNIVQERGQRWSVVKAELDPEVRHQVSRALGLLEKDMASVQRREIKARKKLVSAMGAKSFADEAYDSAITRFDVARAKSGEAKAVAYKALLADLSQEDRKRLAEHLVRHYEGSDQELKSDLAREVEANHNDSWWSFNRYIQPKPSYKPEEK